MIRVRGAVDEVGNGIVKMSVGKIAASVYEAGGGVIHMSKMERVSSESGGM